MRSCLLLARPVQLFLPFEFFLPFESFRRAPCAGRVAVDIVSPSVTTNAASPTFGWQVAQAISAHCKNLQDLSIGYADMADGGTAGGGISRMGWALLIRSLRKVHSLRIKR
jgi:hypothetical protein